MSIYHLYLNIDFLFPIKSVHLSKGLKMINLDMSEFLKIVGNFRFMPEKVEQN